MVLMLKEQHHKNFYLKKTLEISRKNCISNKDGVSRILY
jgi:hypothetical protein